MVEFLSRLFDTSDFPARWDCGNWSAGHGWLHIVSDLGVWSAYVAIPLVLGYFVLRRRSLPFRTVFWLFVAFILACGTTHLMEALIFWWPAYRLAGVIKLATAVVSWATVIALVPVTPLAIAMRSPEELEREIDERKRAEQLLEEKNRLLVEAERHSGESVRALLDLQNELEQRVQQRTAELVQVNQALEAEIAQRRQAEERLGLSEQRFARFTEHLPGLAWIKDEQGRYVYANEAAARAFGASRALLLGKTDDEVFPPDTARQFKSNDRRALEQGSVQLIETLQHPDGVVHHSLVHKFRIPGGSDGATLVGGMAIDITERKQAEEALRRSENRFRAVVNTAFDGIITIDEHGTVENVNPATESIFGYRAGDIIGHNVKLLMPEPYHSEHDAYLANYLHGGQPKVIGIGREVIGRRKDGSTFPLDLAVSEFQLGERRYFTGIVRDITERKRLEQQLEQRVEELAEADRRKDEFLAVLAHELRNPLAPLRNGLQLMRLAGDDAAVREQARIMMDRQLVQLVRMVDDLLDVARITRGKLALRKEWVDLAAVLAQAVEMSQAQIDAAQNSLSIDFPGTTILLEADPHRLAQVFSNLLNNSAKFTRGGNIWLNVERHDAEVLVEIRDNGVGIAPHQLEQIFDLFTQVGQPLEQSTGGLGIGLTLARRLVELHEGSIAASSAGVGKGSAFLVRLPLPRLEWRQSAEAPDDAASAARCGRRILVVDDNRDAALSLSKFLQLRGNEVRTAFDGRDGFLQAADFHPDVAILDIGMPAMNGYDLAQTLRRHDWGKSMTLIALTGFGQDEDRRRARAVGFNHHLVKPVDLAQLERLFG